MTNLHVIDGGRSVDAPDGAIRLGHDLHRVVDDAAEVLTLDADIYQRDGVLVQIVRTADSEEDALMLAGTPQIRAVQPATLVERLTRHTSFVRFDRRREEWVETLPPGLVVTALGARGQWRGVRPIVGVLEAPALTPTGEVMQTAGYDGETGFVFTPNDEFPPVPTNPTQDDAKQALAFLAEPFADFPYATPAGRSAALAAVLTLLARPAIRGSVPGFVFDATTRGSGKTLQADTVSLIATGRPTSKMGYPQADEELEKVLGAYALRGALIVNFDNVSRAFGGAPIDRCLTAGDAVELRVLGKSEVPSLRWRAIVMATGNNVELVGDTARRVLVSRLESPLENPEERTGFRHPDLLGWVRENRPRLVCAALTVLRGYVAAGRPNVGTKSWGSFEAWSALVPPALVWAGAADPMAARPSSDVTVEPEKAALIAILEGWGRLGAGQAMTAKTALDSLYPADRLRGQAAPDGFDDLREAIEVLTRPMPGKPPSVSKLGYALRRYRGRVVLGRKLVGRPDRRGTMTWTVESAGDAGHAGDVSSFRARSGSDSSGVNSQNIAGIVGIPGSSGGVE